MDIGHDSAMPQDEEFVLIDDVEVERGANGEEVVVVKGEAVNEGQAKVAAEDGAVVVPLSDSRLVSRSLSGSLFAGMLLDQRNGNLPNPFSMMRMPERAPVEAPAQAGPASGGTVSASTGIPPVSSIVGSRGAAGDVPDVPPTGDALAMGKEISRLEATIAVLIEKLQNMVESLRTLVASLGGGGRRG